MAGSVHVWAGVADAGLVPAAHTLAMHTLVARAETGATGFDRDPVGNAALAALGELYLLRADTGAAERIDQKPDPIAIIRAAMKPRCFVVVRPAPSFEPLRVELADHRKALAKKALTERMGKPFHPPPDAVLSNLFDETPSERSLQSLASACEAVLAFRFAGEWGIAATMIATGDQGERLIATLGSAGIEIARASTQRDLPMW